MTYEEEIRQITEKLQWLSGWRWNIPGHGESTQLFNLSKELIALSNRVEELAKRVYK